MHTQSIFAAVLAYGLLGTVNAQRNGGQQGDGGQQAQASTTADAQNAGQSGSSSSGNGDSNLCLNKDVISTASEADGQGADGSDAGQAASLTSDNNFIGFCQGKTITNGQQSMEVQIGDQVLC